LLSISLKLQSSRSSDKSLSLKLKILVWARLQTVSIGITHESLLKLTHFARDYSHSSERPSLRQQLETKSKDEFMLFLLRWEHLVWARNHSPKREQQIPTYSHTCKSRNPNTTSPNIFSINTNDQQAFKKNDSVTNRHAILLKALDSIFPYLRHRLTQPNKLQQKSTTTRLLLKELTTKSKKGTMRPWPQTKSSKNFKTKTKRKKGQRFCSTYNYTEEEC